MNTFKNSIITDNNMSLQQKDGINKFLDNVHQRYDEQKINEGRTNFKHFNFESNPEKVINDLNE